MAMSEIWGKLKYADTQIKKTAKLPMQTIEGKRAKLVENLTEQKKIIEADLAGNKHISRKPNGEVKERVQTWFWSHGHQTAFYIKFGFSQLPLPNIGLRPLLFDDRKEIPATIDAIIEAVRKGDLDEALRNAKTPKGKSLAEMETAEAIIPNSPPAPAPTRKSARKV